MTPPDASARLEEALYRILRSQDPEKLRDGLRQRDELAQIKAAQGPQSKEEFWNVVHNKVGVELSTVAVCPGHSSQLDMCWEVYSFAVRSVLWVMNRGGGKTSLAAWMDDIQACYWPGWSSFTIGANRTQGDRKYEYLLPLVVEGGVIGGKELEHVIRSIATRTQYKNGSSIEIALGSSPENANGPRTPRLHRDEVEQMHDDTHKQSANIPAGRKMRDGRYAPAQWLDTSTMKAAEGRVDLAIQAYNKAIENNQRPQQEVRICCIFENSVENPTCRSVPEEERRARLFELGRDPNEVCDCDTYISDVWPVEDEAAQDAEPEPRTLESVCQGRFFRSRGHKEFDDIRGLFLANPRETWSAEQECAQPSTEGAYIRSYNQTRNGIKGYEPVPENGPIIQWVDWGSGDEAHVAWVQILEREVRVRSFQGDGFKTMPVGAWVVFSEIYRAGLGNVELGQLVNEREAEWVMTYPGWRVFERYPDSALLGARLDWRVQCGLETTSRIRKDFVEELKLVRGLVGKRGGFFVDALGAPWMDKSIRAWKQVNGREVHDWSCLPGETMVLAEERWKRIDEVVAGERVWTRAGLRPVVWSGMTKVDDTVIVEHERGELECTADHRIWTQRGWVQAQDLQNNDMILLCRSSAKSSFVSTSTIEESGSTVDQTPPSRPIVTTSAAPIDSSIASSGKTSGVSPCPMDSRSIMSTEIRATISSATFERSRAKSTGGFMGLMSDPRSNSPISHGSVLLPSQLLEHPRVANALERVLCVAGRVEFPWSDDVSIAVVPTRLAPLVPHDSARTTADPLIGEPAASTMSSEHALDVEIPSWSTATPELDTVPARVLRVRSGRGGVPVFDLHVADDHEFVAEGVLVHNSHAMAGLRYGVHNWHVLETKLKRAGDEQKSTPAAADDGHDRMREREAELAVATGSRSVDQMREPGAGVVTVIGTRPDELERDVGDMVGAEDSPVRAGGLSMGGESEWRSAFGRHER